jgi:hypothetical protein
MQYSIRYTQYLRSELWQQRRQAKLQQAKYKCQYCKERGYLQVHHLNYDHFGDEQSNELIVLCPAHHWVADVIRKNGDPELLEKINQPFQKSLEQLHEEQKNNRGRSPKQPSFDWNKKHAR